MWKQMMLGLLLVSLCGCIKNKDELTLNADGSGKVRIETQTSVPPELTEGMSGQLGGSTIIYPPTSESEARKFFPAKDFTVTVKQSKADNGEITTITEAEFKDINVLLASSYGRAHQLSVSIADGFLVVKGVTGMEATARFAEIKDPAGMGMDLPGMADLQKNSGEMRAEFQVTLPNEIAKANGNQTGKTASWIVERAQCKDAEDFARKLAVVSEASCPATGVKMSPAAPVRLGLLPFAELAAAAGLEAGANVDTNRISAAAKFVPFGLSVTRSLDLSGSGGMQESSAQLVGAILIPQELAPLKWGDPQLDEVVDAKGNNLKASEEGDSSSVLRRYSSRESEADEDGATNRVQRHVMTISFRPPDWKINEIARIKGSVSLQYLGDSQLVKLTNAIPAKWIADASKMMRGGVSFDDGKKPLSSVQLASLGLTLSVQMGMAQAGMTMLTLQVAGKQVALTDVQIYVSAGKPWPTFLQQQDFGPGDATMCQLLVAGKPEPPLSLALRASGGGTTVQVPFLLEHVSLAK